MREDNRLIATLCVVLMLSMTGFMPLAAVLPALFVEFSLGETEAGWLTGAYFGGYAASVPFLTAWTDRVDVRRVMLIGLGASAIGGFAFAAFADGTASALVLRMVAGVGLAGVHFPAVKLLADRLEPEAARRGQSFYVSTFSVGGGISFLAAGVLDAWLGWRAVFAMNGAAALAGMLVLGWLVAPRPHAPVTGPPRPLLDLGPVLANREATRYVVSYFGHIWEMFSFRSWLVLLLALSVSLPRNAGFADWNLPLLAAITSFVSMPASMLIGALANRHARRKVIAATALSSCAIAMVLASLAGAPTSLVYGVMLLYALTTYGDTGALATGLMAAADPRARGAALAVYATAGFLGGALGPVMVGAAMEVAGGRHAPGAWSAACLTIGLGSALVACAMLAGPRAPR